MNIKTANRLCELRKAHNLSQEELASKLGVSRQAISKWERSESSPDTDNLIQLAKLYNISIDELINGEEITIEENKRINTVVEIDQFVKVEIKDDIAIVDYNNGEKKEILLKEALDWNEKIKRIDNIVMSGSAMLFVAIYLLLGFLANGWANYWFLFILVPVPSGIINAIFRKKLSDIPIELIVVAIYCAIGMNFKLWHPLWLLVFIIPLFRVLIGVFKNKKNIKQYVVDAYYQVIEE